MSGSRFSLRSVLLPFLAGVLLACAGPLLAGEEKTTSADDLVIHTDTRWTGGLAGGYLPVRVQVTNRGPTRTLLFEVTPHSRENGMPTVKRTITIEQNATARWTLPICIVGFSNGTMEVSHKGVELDSHRRNITVPTGYNLGAVPPAMLVISETKYNLDAYVEAANIIAGGTTGMISAADTADVLSPTGLPDSWLDYTALDLVAISKADLADLRATNRTAILNWVATGGNLIVFNCGKSPADLQAVERLCEFQRHAAGDAKWTEANVRLWPASKAALPTRIESRSGVTITMPTPGPGPRSVTRIAGPTMTKPEGEPWAANAETFRRRRLMAGQVIAMADQPFPGRSSDWHWLFSSLGDQVRWPSRHGMSPRSGSTDFFLFLNPGVRGVPVVPFMILITAFAIAIGPVNYVMLARRKKLWLMLVTVPAIALVTSGLLFGYSTVAHGFSTRTRVRSLTLLDQKSQTAVTTARLSLYAGLAPAGGLKYSKETAVYPAWSPTSGFNGATTDWTETQALESGWLPSRTRTQFQTVRYADERGRIEFKPLGDGKQEASNGLAWNLDALAMIDENGQVYYTEKVPAGGAASMRIMTLEDRAKFRELLGRNAPETPEGFVSARYMPTAWNMRREFMTSIGTDYKSSVLENLLRNSTLTIGDGLKAAPGTRTYVAIVGENPGVEIGTPKTIDEMSSHVIMGAF